MKNLIIALFALISVSASAQKDTAGLKMPVITGNVVYEQVFETPGKTRYQLFNDAQQWFIARYKSFRNIEVTDSVNVRVIGKGKEIVNYVGPLNVSLPFISRMTIQIDCKDGKFRSRMSSINLTPRDTSASGNFVTTPEELVDMLNGKSQINGLNKNQARRLLESLNITINNTMLSIQKALADKNDF